MKPKEIARDALLKLWAHRAELWPDDVDEEEVVRDAPEKFVKHFSTLRLERPMELKHGIPNENGIGVAEIAGILDRRNGTISVAKNASPESQRFTLAHEIGHWLMHPGLSLHRDRPLDRKPSFKPRVEQEADDFAADFLMPPRYLNRVFLECFGGPIALDGTVADKDLAYKLSMATGIEIKAREFADRTPLSRAIVVAKSEGFGPTIFLRCASDSSFHPQRWESSWLN